MCERSFGGGGNLKPLRISFYGDNNTVFINPSAKLSGLIEFYGCNNRLTFDDLCEIDFSFSVGDKNSLVNNSSSHFEPECRVVGAVFQLNEGSSQVFRLGSGASLHMYTCCPIILKGGSRLDIGNNVLLIIKWFELTSDSEVKIGDGSTFHSIFLIADKKSKITIGEDCMFSWNCSLLNHDFHTILDKNTGEILNSKVNEIHIGKHTWVGYGATFFKNVKIMENSIVGMNSFVINSKFDEPNVIIAGSPAKVIKHNINWDRDHPDVYIGKFKEKGFTSIN